MLKGAIEKFECKKVRINICCQDEVFLPDMLSSHSGEESTYVHKDKNLSIFLSNGAQI